MELSIGLAHTALSEAVKKQENMYARYRASQGFQELEEVVVEHRRSV